MLSKVKYYSKHVLYFVFFYSGLLKLLIQLMKRMRSSQSAVILFYHRFSKDGHDSSLLPRLNVLEFEKQMVHLKDFYRIISMDDVADVLRKGDSFSEPSVVVTIDDGYLDNYEVAYPILCKFQIPTVIYLTVGAIANEVGLWVDDIEHIIANAKSPVFRFKELFGDEVIVISTLKDKVRAVERLYLAIVDKNNEERKSLIGKLLEIVGADESSMRAKSRVMLSWNEIREMSDNGIAFGAHTVSHPCLSRIPIGKGKDEIRRSKETIERNILRAVRHFAIPNGRAEDFTENLCEFCSNIGLVSVVTTEIGVVDAHSDIFSLRRILPPPPLYYFACEVARHLILPGSRSGRVKYREEHK